MGQRDSSATVEFISATRLHPPLFETADTVVAAPPEVTRPVRTNVMTRLLPVVMAIATVGMMAVVFVSRSGVARNPVFMTFPLMMLLSAVATAVSGADQLFPQDIQNPAWFLITQAGTTFVQSGLDIVKVQ